MHTDDNVVFGVGRRSAGSEDDSSADDKNMPSDVFELPHVDLTRAQIGRILPQLRWLRQRFLRSERREPARFLPQPIACAPARSAFHETEPAPDKANLFPASTCRSALGGRVRALVSGA